MNREEVIGVLSAWVRDEQDEASVWAWAQSAKAQRSVQDVPVQDVLVRDVIDVLEAMPFDLIDKEDAAVMLDALSNPVDEADLGQNLVWNHLDAIDTDERRRRYREHPFYGPYSGDVV